MSKEEVIVLPEERWPELADVFSTEFDADLPHSGKATILARLVDGEIVGFMVVEFLTRIGQIHNCGSDTREMFDWVHDMIPPGNSLIAIASEPRFKRLCEHFGMREVEGQVFRRDF